MSVVAWDGVHLAADKGGSCAGLLYTVTKLFGLPTGEALAFTGDAALGLVLIDWYKNGADPCGNGIDFYRPYARS